MPTDEGTYDPWDTDKSSGLLRNFDGTVLDAWFATDPNYNAGQSLLLQWQVQVDDAGEWEGDVPEDGINIRFPVGKDWETEDGGKTATHPVGPHRKFHASSMIGKLLDSVKGELVGLGGVDHAYDSDHQPIDTNFDGAAAVLRAKGKPTEAAVWIGSKWRFREVTFDYGTDKAGKEMKLVRAFPVAFLGEAGADKGKSDSKSDSKSDGDDKVAAARAKKAKVKEVEADEADEAAELSAADLIDNIGVNGETKSEILAALSTAEDHSTFVDLALEINGVVENDELMKLVVEDGTGGLWAVR